jgi:hypothetical protein
LSLSWRPREQTNAVVVHDTHTKPDIAHVEAYLLTKGLAMGLLDIGYHFVIERDGDFLATRSDHLIGNHAPHYNLDTIGIALVGGLDEEGRQVDNFTEEQRDTLAFLIAYCQLKYTPPFPLRVSGHTELARFKDRDMRCPATDMVSVRASWRPVYEQIKDTPLARTDKTADLASQRKLVRDYLEHGRLLTNRRALLELGIGSLSSRIAELRAEGVNIQDRWERDGHGARLKTYFIPEAREAYVKGTKPGQD